MSFRLIRPLLVVFALILAFGAAIHADKAAAFETQTAITISQASALTPNASACNALAQSTTSQATSTQATSIGIDPKLCVVGCTKSLSKSGVGSTCSCSASGPGASCTGGSGSGQNYTITCKDNTGSITCSYSANGTSCSCV